MQTRNLLTELRNELSSFLVEDIAPGVRLAVYRSNADELAHAGRGGMLNVEFSLELNPEQKRVYTEPVYAHVNVNREMLSAFDRHRMNDPVQAQMRIRNTWPTPEFVVEQFREVKSAASVSDFVRNLVWAAVVFVQDHYRKLVTTLHSCDYFVGTDWNTNLARYFLEHMRVQSCQSTAA